MVWVQVDFRKVACKICFISLFRGHGLQFFDLDPKPVSPKTQKPQTLKPASTLGFRSVWTQL